MIEEMVIGMIAETKQAKGAEVILTKKMVDDGRRKV